MSNPTNQPTRRLADVQEVADMLRCSAKTVRRLSDAGKIPGKAKVGRLIRFDLVTITRWIGQGCPPLHRFDRGDDR